MVKTLVETLHASIDAHAFSGVVSLRQGGQVLFEQAAVTPTGATKSPIP